VNGPEHPDTLKAINNLAISYAAAGRNDEALKLREEVLPLRRKVLGPENPDTVQAMANLAMSYDAGGRKEEAKALRAEVETVKENALPSLAEMRLGDLPTLRARSERRARAGEWKEAIADERRVLEIDSSFHYDWYLMAPLLLQVGDLDGYQTHRHEMLQRFGSTTDLPTMERIAKASLLLPLEGAELETASKLADAALTLGKNHQFLAYFQFAAGLARYRQGQFLEAIAMLQTVIDAPGVPERRAQAYAVLTMAQHRLQKRYQARNALYKADELAAAFPPTSNWQDVLIAKLLLSEAKALMAVPPGK
jgi:tetratricopeptide (TPR) repeat protein